ncbi:hypothetical protein [Sulfurimonas sp.]|jgi:hypothetical protein|uniref:hypothetical protein n=1 Tax=Sulfurimonas sp. TaxID=2022749 RepID=UPI0025E12A2C|nr:hypothetical protein [Sulfurimonas sp.]MBT5935202.1 hypothetical protein [Sulfurimonas sp.]
MIEDALLNYLLLYIVLEIYEVQWQKANTMIGMLARMYEQYRKNIFVFLLMQPTFYFSIMFAIISNYNEYALVLVGIKTIDIVTKMTLIRKVFIEKNLSAEMTLALLSPLNKFMPYVGLLVYAPLIYLVFNS